MPERVSLFVDYIAAGRFLGRSRNRPFSKHELRLTLLVPAGKRNTHITLFVLSFAHVEASTVEDALRGLEIFRGKHTIVLIGDSFCPH